MNHVSAQSVTVWWKRIGLAGFLFFFIKGLCWLSAPLILYWLH